MSDDNCAMLCCASCGIEEIDDIKLIQCDVCDLVRYCSDDCQRDHKSQHAKVCKTRAAELRDELLFKRLLELSKRVEACKKRVAALARDNLLFKQPECTHLGDCPICCLPMPLGGAKKCCMSECCSKTVCIGCAYADIIVRKGEREIDYTCAFCREPSVVTEEESHKRRMKRIEANDPVAMVIAGVYQYDKRDYIGASEYWKKAAEFGDVDAHCRLAKLYHLERGVEKDERKALYHMEEAAIGGHPDARYTLGVKEWNKGNIERAVKHWAIAATQGHDDSIKKLMVAFKGGYVSKEVLATALREHQAALAATKSPQREAAEEFYSN